MSKREMELRNPVDKFKWAVLIVGSFLILFGTFQRIFTFAALGMFAAVMVFGDDEMAVLSIVYIMPFGMIFKSAPGATSFLTYLMLLYALKEMLVMGVLPGILIPFLAYVMIGQCAAQDINPMRTIKLAASLLFVFYSVLTRDRYSVKKVFIAFIIAIIFSSLFSFLDSNIFRVSSYIEEADTVGENVRFSGLSNDANMYVINVIISLCLLVVLCHKEQMKKTYAVLCAAPLVYFAISTYSKSAILMLFLPLACLIYSNQKQKKYMVQIIVAASFAIVLAGVLAGNIHAFDVVLERFTKSGGDINKLTTGRTNLWLWYINYYFEHPDVLLFGRGLGAGLINPYAVHNTFLQIPYYNGIIGEIWLFFLLRSILCYTTGKRDLIQYSVLVAILCMYFFLSELFDHQAPIHLLLCGLVLNDQLKGSESAHEESTCCDQ